MKSHKFDADILDTDIKIKRDKERVEEISFDYHNDLLNMMDMKIKLSREQWKCLETVKHC